MLSPDQVDSRSNSDGLNVRYVLDRMELSASERMTLILRIAEGWDMATQGSVGRYGADRVLDTHHDNGWRKPEMPLRTPR